MLLIRPRRGLQVYRVAFLAAGRRLTNPRVTFRISEEEAMRSQFGASPRSFWFLVLFAVSMFAPSSALAITVNVGGDFQVLDAPAGGTCPPTCTFAGATNFPTGGILNFSGTVMEIIVPRTSAKLILTDFVAINAGTGNVDTDVNFRSSPFAAIGPPVIGTVHLDGNYSSRGGIVRDAHAGLTGFANTTQIGFVDASHILGQPGEETASIPFTDPATGQSPPSDISKELNLAVTFLVGDLSLHLAPSDRVRLPDSGFVSVVATPEPTTFVLVGTIIVGLGLAGWTKRRAPLSYPVGRLVQRYWR